jgi:excisionase family DNA binding protein
MFTSSMSSDRYCGGQEASKLLGVHQRTLYNWEARGQIETMRTPGNKRLYNVGKYLNESKLREECPDDIVCDLEEDAIDADRRVKIIYARVSSHGQKLDLGRQIEDLCDRYPNHKLIKDIGSGVNLNRKGLRKIIDMAIAGHVKELVVSHKDRLARFGYELIVDLVRDYSGGDVVIVYQSEALEPEEELAKDVLTIMNVFVARMNGLRKYRKQ